MSEDNMGRQLLTDLAGLERMCGTRMRRERATREQGKDARAVELGEGSKS
jgi:hypothetical protein